MKTKLFSLFILVALFAFAKPTSAQGFQDQTIVFTVYSPGLDLVVNHYDIYARVVTLDGILGAYAKVDDFVLPGVFPGEYTVYAVLPVWVPEIMQMGYYRVGVAVQGMSGANTPVGTAQTGASPWCNSSDLYNPSDPILVKVN